MFKRLCLVLALCTGCRSKQALPTGPGTSTPLTYPVVLIGQGDVAVRDNEAALTSTTLASGLNFTERKIVDSSGILYEVRKATPVGKTTAWWRDMGTSQQAYYLELERTRQAGLDRIKRLVLDQVESPHSVWAGNANAVARVRGFSSVADLIAQSHRSWEWTSSGR